MIILNDCEIILSNALGLELILCFLDISHALLYVINSIVSILCFSFPDQEIRNVAVQQLDNLLNDELLEYLPQLVQVRTAKLPRDSRILTNNSLKQVPVNQQ